MNEEELLDIIRDVLLDYNFGSDSPRLGYKDGMLTLCTTSYNWYKIECEYNVKSLLENSIRLILEDNFMVDWHKF